MTNPLSHSSPRSKYSHGTPKRDEPYDKHPRSPADSRTSRTAHERFSISTEPASLETIKDKAIRRQPLTIDEAVQLVVGIKNEEIRDGNIYFTIVRALAGKQEHHNHVLWAFEQANRFNCAANLTYVKFIDHCISVEEFQKASDAFKSAIRQNLPLDKFVIIKFIKAAGTLNWSDDVIMAFEHADKMKVCDHFTYTHLFNALKKSVYFPRASRAFDRAVEQNALSPYNVPAYLKYVSGINQMNEVSRVISIAEPLGLMNEVGYRFAFAGARMYKNLPKAIQYFNELLNGGFLNNIHLREYIIFMRTFKRFDLAYDAYNRASTKITIEAETSACLMKSAKKYADVLKVYRIFNALKESDMKSPVMYAGIIKSLRESHQFSESDKVFEEGKKLFPNNVEIYNAYIASTKSKAYFMEARKAYEEAKSLGIDDDYTTASYLRAIASCQEALEIKKVFDEYLENIRRKGKTPEEHVFSDAIRAAGDVKRFQIALDVFYHPSCPRNGKVFATFIETAGICNRFKEAKDAFEKATKSRNSSGDTVYGNYIRAAYSNGHEKTTYRAYRTARRIELMTQYIVSSFLEAAERFPTLIEEAKAAFEDGIERGFLIPRIYNQWIRTAGVAKRYDWAKEAFADAKKNDAIDASTYNDFIFAAGLNNQFNDAKTTLKEAIDLGFATPETHEQFIKVACDLGYIEEANDALNLAESYDLQTVPMYASVIKLAAKKQMIGLVEKTSLKALRAFPDECSLYSLVIRETRKNHRPDLALKAFSEALHHAAVNPATFNAFLEVLRDVEDFDIASKLLKVAKNAGKADLDTFTLYIKIARDAKAYQEAKAAFDEIRLLANSSHYANLIQAADRSGLYEECNRLLTEAAGRGLADERVLTVALHAFGNQGDFQAVDFWYNEAQEYRLDDILLTSTYIEALGKVPGEKMVLINAFNEAKINHKCNAETYAAFIFSASRYGMYPEALGAYQESIDEGLYHEQIFNRMIEAAGIYLDETRVFNVFHQAKLHNQCTIETVNHFIKALKELVPYKFNLIEQAQLVYQEHIEHANEDTYLNMIEMCFLLSLPQNAIEIYTRAKVCGLATSQIRAVTINQLIQANEFQMAFDLALAFRINLDPSQENQTIIIDKAHADAVSKGQKTLKECLESDIGPKTFGLKIGDKGSNVEAFQIFILNELIKRFPKWNVGVKPDGLMLSRAHHMETIPQLRIVFIDQLIGEKKFQEAWDHVLAWPVGLDRSHENQMIVIDKAHVHHFKSGSRTLKECLESDMGPNIFSLKIGSDGDSAKEFKFFVLLQVFNNYSKWLIGAKADQNDALTLIRI